MKLLEAQTLFHTDITACDIEVVEQHWNDGSQYLGYEKTPRKKSGFIRICDGLQAHYKTEIDSFTARPGDLIYTPEGCRYRVQFECFKKPVRINAYVVNFRLKDNLGNLITLSDTLCTMARDEHHRLKNLIAELSSACHGIPESPLMKKTRFYELLLSVLSGQQEKDRDYYPIRKGIEKLKVEWNENKSIAHYAALCGVSESYFRRLFKRWSGVTPVTYRNQLRVSYAKTLLKSAQMTLNEIAEYTGFDDPFYFGRIFKSISGVSPGKYKKDNEY